MDGPRDCHNELSKSDREREISYDIVYMQNLKIYELIKQKQIQRMNLWLPRWGRGRTDRELGIDMF